MDFKCAGCGDSPDEIFEYIDAAGESGMTPDEYVEEHEGTFNKSNGHFWCSPCYIQVGMPLGVAP